MVQGVGKNSGQILHSPLGSDSLIKGTAESWNSMNSLPSLGFCFEVMMVIVFSNKLDVLQF